MKHNPSHPKTGQPTAPRHLKAATKKWWKAAVATFELEAHHLRLLQLACEAWDRAQEARAVIDEKGLSYDDRFGAPRLRPEVNVERDARISFARLVRDIGLDAVGTPDSPKIVG